MTDPLTEMLASLKEKLRAATPGKQHNVLAYADGPCGQLACDALAQLRKLAEGRTG